MAEKMRILVIAHGHPDFSIGGAEVAAYNLYRSYGRNELVEEAFFLARIDRNAPPGGRINQYRDREYLWEQGISDWHMMRAAERSSLTTWLPELLRALRPTVVHVHHYAHMGLEFLRVIKRVDPSIRLVVTLHEYMAICRNNGQMIKPGSGQLCYGESLEACSRCFPEHSSADFWLRKRRFRSHFDLVDHFVSPSAFLRSRYVAWGIPEDRISVIENGQDDSVEPLPPRPLGPGGRRSRFGYFGQINPYKGLHVLLEAMHALDPEVDSDIVLEVHGTHLDKQEKSFQDKVNRLAAPLLERGALRWAGAYRPDEVRHRMAGIDWLVIPSVWWENSPMVIQESFLLGRPVLCSNIGGMAEKVRDGVDGLHVQASSPVAWAEKLSTCAARPETWDELHNGTKRPLGYEDCARRHLTIFSSESTSIRPDCP